jgi:putative hydrolase of the HAD superfamily
VIETVLWDADGVLQRVPNGWEESMRPAVAGRVDDVDAFLAEASREERPALTGEVRWLDVLPGLLERWGIADSFDTLVGIWLSIEEVPGTRDVVRSLRSAGIRCCLATNQDVRRATYMRTEMGYDDLLDDVFVSCDLGVAKPDPAYFTTILDRLDAPADRVLFVDDNAKNVDAARAVGLAAEVWSSDLGLAELESTLRGHGLPLT